MKKYIFLSIVVSLSVVFSFGQTSPSEILAQRIANVMKDTLSMNTLQTQKVYNINLLLSSKKTQARTASTDRTIVGSAIQAIERTRDSLYKAELTTIQYQLYLQKKRNIIKNN